MQFQAIKRTSIVQISPSAPEAAMRCIAAFAFIKTTVPAPEGPGRVFYFFSGMRKMNTRELMSRR